MGRSLWFLVWVIYTAARAPADDLLADLRAEVAATVATASVKCQESPKGDGGPMVRSCSLSLSGESATYVLAYKSFLPPNHTRNRSGLNDGASGLGMVQPSIHGWYSNGFVDVAVSNDKTHAAIGDGCGNAFIVRESGKVAAGDFVWDLPTGQVTLRFFILAERPELFLLVYTRPTFVDARIQVSFQCYPRGFHGPFDRVVHTAAQRISHAGPQHVTKPLDPLKEPWALLADHHAGVTPRPMGPCSVAVAPENIAAAGVIIKSNYSVLPFYELAPGE